MDSEQQKQLVARWTHAESSFDAGHHPKLGDFGANLVAECIKEKVIFSALFDFDLCAI
jgi:hypothetical protein